MAAHQRPEHPADAVAALRQVDAGRAGVGRAERRRVGVGDGFETGQTGRQDEKADQEGAEGADLGRGNEPEGANRNQRQADDDPALVAKAPGQHPGRNSHKEVPHVVRELHERRLCLGDVQRVLEVLVEHVDHAVAQSPKQKERADQ